MKISPARKACFDILQKIEKEKAFSSILLPLFEEKLSDKDKRLCHQVTLGVLRKKLFLDRIINFFTKKDLAGFDIEVINSLRIGIYQLKFLDRVPPYSAINESVNLVKYARKKSAAGLVNAVLRKVSKKEISLSFQNDLEELSVKTSHPLWLIEKWKNQFGIDETEKIARANNESPKLSFRFTGKFFKYPPREREKIYQQIKTDKTIFESKLKKGSFESESHSEFLKTIANENLIYFQDVGSQIVADSVALEKGDSFLDLCASPGSKITQIGAGIIEKGLGNFIFAGDYFWHRMAVLKENCLNQKISNMALINYDAEKELPFQANTFDKLLVDAPCSGTGTIRHNPEIRYKLKTDDFKDLQIKQLNILNNASKVVKSGGQIIYSTCSFEVEENEDVINKFLEINEDFQKYPPILPSGLLTEDEFGRTFPNRNQTDGFFIANLVKK